MAQGLLAMGLLRAARDSTSSQGISPEPRDGASCDFGRLKRSHQKFGQALLRLWRTQTAKKGHSQVWTSNMEPLELRAIRA
eukprot:CAMPEP_0181494248 /NCGR_PEP_ID=MMETSP1110-20121109/51663_1 /TAXON_ID=174948 /ORGANISM="Symbiodinium sp., Strain CCMP421" /LENGTH=80 /DNA_ID=CAMNT_0023621633 /DNA_START=1 /DNA_END=239 /DNA_ORIENTATION=-